MSNFNRVILVGRLTRDPEVRFTSSGTQISTFTLAVNRNVPNNVDDNVQTVDFIRIVSFGKLAEFVSNYLTKGRLILVEGSLRMRKWQTQSGEPRTTAEVVASGIQFMEPKPKGEITEKVEDLEEPSEETLEDELGLEELNEDSDEIPF